MSVIDYDVTLDLLYDVHGIDAEFVSREGGPHVDLVVIDKREGVEGESIGLVLQGMKPAACVRVSEVEERGLDKGEMSRGRLTFAGQSWKVESTQPKPKPGSKGELILFLQEMTNG